MCRLKIKVDIKHMYFSRIYTFLRLPILTIIADKIIHNPHRNNTGEGIKENEDIHGNIITHYIPKEWWYKFYIRVFKTSNI